MIFTDDDLKRLKEDLYKSYTSYGWPHIQQTIEALLARLEAAESALETMIETHNDTDLTALSKVLSWRETSGR